MMCLCASTRVAARAITRVYEAELRAVGVQAPQFWLLWEISSRQPVSQAALLKDVAIDQTTLSRNLAVLVRRGWVVSEAKGRLRLYSVTKAGLAARQRAEPKWKQAQDRMKAALGADWEIVKNAIGRLAAAAESTLEEKA